MTCHGKMVYLFILIYCSYFDILTESMFSIFLLLLLLQFHKNFKRKGSLTFSETGVPAGQSLAYMFHPSLACLTFFPP